MDPKIKEVVKHCSACYDSLRSQMAVMPYNDVKEKVTRARGFILSTGSYNVRQFVGFSMVCLFESMMQKKTAANQKCVAVIPTIEEYIEEGRRLYLDHLKRKGCQPDSLVKECDVQGAGMRDFLAIADKGQVPTQMEYAMSRLLRAYAEFARQKLAFYDYFAHSKRIAQGVAVPLYSVDLDHAGADVIVCSRMMAGGRLVDFSFLCVTLNTDTKNANAQFGNKLVEARTKFNIQKIEGMPVVSVKAELRGFCGSLGDFWTYRDVDVLIDNAAEKACSSKLSTLSSLCERSLGDSYEREACCFFVRAIQHEMTKLFVKDGREPVDLFKKNSQLSIARKAMVVV